MRFNLSVPITDLDGAAMKDGDAEHPLTYGQLGCRVLSMGADERDSGEQKFAYYRLALRIQEAPEAVEMKAEEVAKLKTLIGRRCSPLVVGRFWDLLEKPLPEPAQAATVARYPGNLAP